MNKTAAFNALAVLVAVAASGERLAVRAAQTPADPAALRGAIEQRFDVDRLRNGVALRPRAEARGTGLEARGIRLLEIADGVVAIDGQPATGAELRDKLGAADADLVLQLSYLSDSDRRALFAAPPDQTLPPDPAPTLRRRDRTRFRARFDRHEGDRVSIFSGGIEIREGERVEGNAVAIGGSVGVDGEVRGDVVSVGGRVRLGPRASVGQNVVVVGGKLERDPQAQVGGRVNEISIGSFDFGRHWHDMNPMWFWWGSMMGSVVAFVGTLTRLAIMCLMAAFVILIGQKHVERTGEYASAEPLKSGAIGLLAQILFIPVLVLLILLLVVTIIGIPLLILVPFLILGLMFVGFVGFTAVAHRIGRALCLRFGWAADSPYRTTIVGIVAVMLPLLLARLLNLGGLMMLPVGFGLGLIGALVEYVVWTVGFGAVALARFSHRPWPSVGPSTGTPAAPPAPAF
jgi:hypothetical protein